VCSCLTDYSVFGICNYPEGRKKTVPLVSPANDAFSDESIHERDSFGKPTAHV
jgi:hypothetical protein